MQSWRLHPTRHVHKYRTRLIPGPRQIGYKMLRENKHGVKLAGHARQEYTDSGSPVGDIGSGNHTTPLRDGSSLLSSERPLGLTQRF